MKILIIDTSREFSFLALAEKEAFLSQESSLHGNQLSKNLLPSIQNLLKEKPQAIAVGIGPGSFTGTRIGVAVAKSLAFAWDLPLIGFSSALAYPPEKLPAFLHEQLQEYDPKTQINLIY